MGLLREAVEESLRNFEDTNRNIMTTKTFKEMKAKFMSEKGKYYLLVNHKSKRPILVQVTEVYDRCVIVEQHVFNLDKEEGVIRHSLSYQNLYAGLDKLEEIG